MQASWPHSPTAGLEISDEIAPFANVTYVPPADDDAADAASGKGPPSTRVWVQSEGARWQSAFANWSHFSSSLFPLWPSEAVSGLTADAGTRAVAQADSKALE